MLYSRFTSQKLYNPPIHMSVQLKNSGMTNENTRIQISVKYSSTQWKPFALPKAGPEKYYDKVWEGSTQKFTDRLSIGNWVMYKRGLDSEDSYLKFIIEFREKCFFNFISCSFLVRTLQYL